jgi:hypothetical protein
MAGDQTERLQLPVSRDNAGSTAGTNPGTSTLTIVDTSNDGLVGVYPYSGADIKLVVHLPPEDPGVQNNNIDEMIEELERLQQAIQMASTPEETTQTQTRIRELHIQVEEANNLLRITPEGTTEYTELENDINTANAEITSLTAIVNTSPDSAERERMQQQIDDLTRSIQAEREGQPQAPTARTKVLAEVQTLSLSVHREKYPVRTLGAVYPRSYTRGPRTISGSLVFTTFNQHIMHEFLESTEYRSTGVGDWDRFQNTSYIMDQIPPLDISISFANEYGNLSWMAILGVEFINEGQVMSIEDLYMEGTAQYVARDFDPIRNVANRTLSRAAGVSQALTVTGTSIMTEDLRRRVAHRNIPWI